MKGSKELNLVFQDILRTTSEPYLYFTDQVLSATLFEDTLYKKKQERNHPDPCPAEDKDQEVFTEA
jgi:hypothetical protein